MTGKREKETVENVRNPKAGNNFTKRRPVKVIFSLLLLGKYVDYIRLVISKLYSFLRKKHKLKVNITSVSIMVHRAEKIENRKNLLVNIKCNENL